MRDLLRPLVCLAALVASSAPSPASACSGFPTSCSAGVLLPASKLIPQNATTFLYRAGAGERDAVLEELVEGSPSASIALEQVAEPTGGIWLVPGASLAVGKRYRLTVSHPCESWNEEPPEVVTAVREFEVTEAVPIPETLGALQILSSGDGSIPVENDAACWEEIDVNYVDVTPDFAGVDPGLRAVLIKHRVIVDGASFSWEMSANGSLEDESGHDPFADEPYRKQGVFRLWTWCAGGADDNVQRHGLSPGSHEAVVEAEIPGPERKVLRSVPVTVELDCEPPPSCSGDDCADGSSDGDDDGAEGGDGSDGAEDGDGSDGTDEPGSEPDPISDDAPASEEEPSTLR